MMQWFFTKKARVTFSVVLVLLLLVTSISCGEKAPAKAGVTPTAVGPAYKWALGHIWAPTHPAAQGVELFAELANQRTQGRVKIEVQAAGALGGDTALMTAVSKGDLFMAYVHTYGFEERLLIYDMPYLARDWEDVDKLWHGKNAPIRNVVDKVLRDHDVMLVGTQGADNDFRGLTNSKRLVKKPADVAGLKLRLSPTDTYQLPFKEGLGASPIWIAFPELYQAMQTGTVDGQDNGIVSSYTNKFFEVQKYYTDLRHVYSPGYLIVNVTQWNKLPDDIKAALEKSWDQAALYAKGLSRPLRSEYLKMAQTQYGVQVYVPTPEEWAMFKDLYIKYSDPAVQKAVGKELFDQTMKQVEEVLGRKIR